MQRVYLWICKRWGPVHLTLSALPKKAWRRICALYVLACQNLRKDRLTLSAWAWKHYRETGDSWARNRIDGLALLVAGQRDHCQAQYARETSVLTKQ